jgi:hypothetical protein
MNNQKKHLVNIWYDLPNGESYSYLGFVSEVIGENKKAIVFPANLFRQAFGFKMPDYTKITIL